MGSEQFPQDKRIQLDKSTLSKQYQKFLCYHSNSQLRRFYIPKHLMMSNTRLDK